MKLTDKHNKEYLIKKFEEKQWLRLVLYGAVAVLGIWALGKAAKLLTDVTINFKNLKNAIKQ